MCQIIASKMHRPPFLGISVLVIGMPCVLNTYPPNPPPVLILYDTLLNAVVLRVPAVSNDHYE